MPEFEFPDDEGAVGGAVGGAVSPSRSSGASSTQNTTASDVDVDDVDRKASRNARQVGGKDAWSAGLHHVVVVTCDRWNVSSQNT